MNNCIYSNVNCVSSNPNCSAANYQCQVIDLRFDGNGIIISIPNFNKYDIFRLSNINFDDYSEHMKEVYKFFGTN